MVLKIFSNSKKIYSQFAGARLERSISNIIVVDDVNALEYDGNKVYVYYGTDEDVHEVVLSNKTKFIVSN